MQGLVIAGTHSGCGKTTITLGLLAALKKKGLRIQSFKAGPDFIDSGLHSLITGRPSRNLDIWMCGENSVIKCFKRHTTDVDIAVIEGVMGLYDGQSDGKSSTAGLATLLNLPVLLVVDAYGMAESAGAVVKGFVEYKRQCPVPSGTGQSTPKSFATGQAEHKMQSPHSPQRIRLSAEVTRQGGNTESQSIGTKDTELLKSKIQNLKSKISFTGVIFNRVASENHYRRLKNSVHDIPVLGYLPRELNFEIPHRHLGLTVAEENPITRENIERLADTVLEHIDVEAMFQKGKSEIRSQQAVREYENQSFCHSELDSESNSFNVLRAQEIPKQVRDDKVCQKSEVKSKIQNLKSKIRVAVAYDKAFCFYYEDNLDLLKDAGAEIIRFSLISDSGIPDNADAVYIGGGYPELYAGELSMNASMLRSIRGWADSGRPLYAECGGLIYLSQGIRDFRSNFFKMAGVLTFETQMKKGIAHLGYREILLREDCIMGKKGDKYRGHEFHYSEIKGIDSAAHNLLYTVKNSSGKDIQDEGYSIKKTLASYIHIHFGSNLRIARNFIDFIRESR